MKDISRVLEVIPVMMSEDIAPRGLSYPSVHSQPFCPRLSVELRGMPLEQAVLVRSLANLIEGPKREETLRRPTSRHNLEATYFLHGIDFSLGELNVWVVDSKTLAYFGKIRC